MKNTNLIRSTVLAIMLLFVGAVFAQDKKMDMPKGAMDMAAMHKDGHHALMMAYHHNAMAFTRVLWDMSASGKIDDIELARAAFAEVKRSIDKMDGIHKMHMSKMGKMDAAMVEKMKPMMAKMEADKAALMGHLQSLENALKANSPSAAEIEMHAAVILLRLQKAAMKDKKMEM